MSKKKSRFPDNPNPTADPVIEPPQSCYDMVNKYGRCNVQETAATPNAFPTIAQGLPKGKKVEPRR